MKRLLLHRSVSHGQAGATIEVTDSIARVLLGCPSLGEPPSATLLADLGVDVPVRPIRVRLLRACSVNGGPQSVGSVVAVSERDGRLLVSLNKGEIVGGTLPEVPVPDGGDPVQEAARDRGPLVRPLGRGESVK